ncbi:uncharacterized protein T551_02969 [Pneumocystis jirovecii RU7]|uniref:Amino acid transporter transmembrane domain-containing protein n=1 Tax=Pneumocystis jirovecii (strain RU7) TaxID=1408657 RepID=A0A0W4ZGG3_PNEJ7|nr:uncharacterized protein T551_02969 [Pneumocystis jirovecii RU7]KTW27470.1 hypothetical protein T551_02969 [Pneumocystis jirovecii RU7]
MSTNFAIDSLSNKPDSFDEKDEKSKPPSYTSYLVNKCLNVNESHKTKDSYDKGFSSLKMQGGDIHRNIYRWKENVNSQHYVKSRSQSFNLSNLNDNMFSPINMSQLQSPGGFRRGYIQMEGNKIDDTQTSPKYLSFLEFLDLYWKFFGENLKYYENKHLTNNADNAQKSRESLPLLSISENPCTADLHKDRKMDIFKAILLLLKSFVGTGVLFLPKAFSYGGMLFSPIILVGVALLSLYCFIVLIKIRAIIPGSYGDMGYAIYGPIMKFIILLSIALSQILFGSAYTIFVSENISALIKSITSKQYYVSPKWLIFSQFIIFVPFVLIRNISKLSTLALIADVLILLGIAYLYYVLIFTLTTQGLNDITILNTSSFSFFIGTAVLSFESIGLILPIAESITQPKNVYFILYLVMAIVTVVFTSVGILGYAAYGSKVHTLIFLNMLQSKVSMIIQILYCIAVMLSTPLQLFPAIKIIESKLLTGSGRLNPYVRWKKNFLRVIVVLIMALIAWSGSKNLERFISLVGSIACIPLVYMYPSLLHLKVCAKQTWSKICDISVCLIGAFAMIYVTIVTIQSLH